METRYIEPLAVPLPAFLLPAGPVDPVGLVIVETRMGFERGEELYKAGYLKRAKEEFDAAVDLLLNSANLYPANPRLEKELDDVIAKIHALELAALRNGDGFTDQNEEHAAIDDLQNVQTFPSLIDPRLRKEVEEDVREA